MTDSIDIARKNHNKIKQNLFWAFFYNLISFPLAIFDLIHQMITGAAMILSNVIVVNNALLLK